MKISNWNGRPKVDEARLLSIENGWTPKGEFCPRGNGRSYGDASLQSEMLDLTKNKKTLKLNDTILEVSSGFSAGEALNFIVPKGFILPVIPGTQHATIGGMIAADIHGKNHAQNGTLGRWIESLKIGRPNGEIIDCSSQNNSQLFNTTIGGLGLTGVIISAKIKLISLNSITFQQNVQSFDQLNSLLDSLWKSDADYKTGWFDFYTMNTFLLIENRIKKGGEIPTDFQLKKPKISIPFKSVPFVQPFVMKAYNKRYAKKMLKPQNEVLLDDVLFPLDRISNWNYLYGTRGFYQLQFQFERENILPKIERIFEVIHASGFLPVLSVIKKHGTLHSPGILSFPKPGFSFAFDFIYKKGIEKTLLQLNEIIAEESGQVYLVKDALLSEKQFQKMYPEATQFKNQISEYNSGRISSLLSKRLNLTP